MRLDRNTNPDGKGKYALINLRTNQVQWGGDDQFFVIKYKDEFAAPALQAYAQAVFQRADEISDAANNRFEELSAQGKHRDALYESGLLSRKAEGLREFGSDILREAEAAGTWQAKNYPINL